MGARLRCVRVPSFFVERRVGMLVDEVVECGF
jgi:hypothetical protein